MSQQNVQQSAAIRIDNLLLMEESFQRVPVVTFDDSQTERNMGIDVQVNLEDNGNRVIVNQSLEFKQQKGELSEYIIFIRMVGVFVKDESLQIDMEQFGYVNGAAIIFPYIREQLTNLAAKAGLGTIVLPPVIFSKNNQEAIA